MKDTSNSWHLLSDRLARFVRRRVADTHAADDIVQETLIRTLTAFGNATDDESAVTRWAYRTARNLVIDRHRRVKRHTSMGVEAVASPQVVTDTSRSHEIALGTCALHMLSRLDTTYRDALMLADLQGISQQALAERLEISVSGMKSRVQRGRAKLRGMLLDCCQIDFDRRGNVKDHQCVPRSN